MIARALIIVAIILASSGLPLALWLWSGQLDALIQLIVLTLFWGAAVRAAYLADRYERGLDD